MQGTIQIVLIMNIAKIMECEHAENYINFTEPLDFKIKSEYRSNNQLKSRITQFKEEVANGSVDGDQYHKF